MISKVIYGRLTASGTQTQAIVGDGVFPDLDTAAGTRFVVYDPDDGESLQKMSGPTGLTEHTVGVSVVGGTRLECEQLADAVKADLDGQSGTWGGFKVQGAFLINGDAQVYALSPGGERKLFAKDLTFQVWKES